MSKKLLSYLLSYMLMFISFLVFFTSAGYYLFWFDWQVSGLKIAINIIFILLSIAITLITYAQAEKIKSRI